MYVLMSGELELKSFTRDALSMCVSLRAALGVARVFRRAVLVPWARVTRRCLLSCRRLWPLHCASWRAAWSPRCYPVQLGGASLSLASPFKRRQRRRSHALCFGTPCYH